MTNLETLLATVSEIIADQSVKNISDRMNTLEQAYLAHKLEAAGLKLWTNFYGVPSSKDTRFGGAAEIVISPTKKKAIEVSRNSSGYFNEKYRESGGLEILRLAVQFSECTPDTASCVEFEGGKWTCVKQQFSFTISEPVHQIEQEPAHV